MKKILLLIAFCGFMLTTCAQQDSESKTAVDRFITLFNEQKFDEIYDSFAPGFKQQVPRENGTALLSQVYSMAGNLESAVFVSANSGRYSYLIKGKRANIAFQFNLTDKKLDKIRISPAAEDDDPPPMNMLLLKTDNPKATSIDIFVNDKLVGFQQANKITGVEIGMLSNGKVNYYSYGETIKRNNKLPSKAALFDIGSISKTFTAYILASLVNEGKITLETRLDKYFNGLEPKVAAITIVQLANHTAGMPNMGSIPTGGVIGRDPNEQYTPADLETDLKKIKLVSEPGTKFNYSNLGFGIIGYILEKASGKTYQQLLDKYILIPNKMTNTFYQAPLNYTDPTKGYNQAGTEKDYLKLNTYGPAGNIKSTAEDLIKYAQLLMGNDKAALLCRKITYTPEQGNKIGLSWIIIPMNGTAFFFHNGATIGYRSYIAIEPATQKALVILNNSAFDVTNLGMQIMQQVLAL